MATYTENYNLVLTEAEDAFDIADYNENFETIDTLMAENEAATNEINEKLGTPENNETVFSLLKAGGSIIKSIQRIKHSVPEGAETSSVNINPVNVEKTIVIFERLHDNYTFHMKMDYELHEDCLTFKHLSYLSPNHRETLFGFWIIEFN